MKTYQIGIDGPSGVGKSSIAKAICEKLGYIFINTGGMYRCYALALIKNNTDLNDIEQVLNVLKHNKVTLKQDKLFLNGKDVTKQIADPKVAAMASKIGTIKEVRQYCVAAQQEIANGINCVMEGRDITSVVLPNATLKVYLDADVNLRAERRWKQNGCVEPLEVAKEKIIKRDNQDSHRKESPLIKVPDAFAIYDTGMTIDEVANVIIDELKRRIHE